MYSIIFIAAIIIPPTKHGRSEPGKQGSLTRTSALKCQGSQEGREGPGYQCSSFANAPFNFLCEGKASSAFFFPFFSFRIAMLFWMCVHGLTSLPLVLQGTKYYIYICLKKREKRKPCINYKNKLLRYPRWVKHPVLSTSCFVSF